EDLAAKHLVGRFHVGQPREKQQVGQPGQAAVCNAGAQRYAARVVEEPRPVDDVGSAAEDRGEQSGIFLRVQFEIGVLHQHDVSARIVQTEADGGALAEIDLIVMDPDAWVRGPAARVDRESGAIARAVVGDDDLLLDWSEIDGEHTLDHFADRLFFVVHGDHDRELHGARYDGRR